jgi:hypothetical protein
MACGQHGRLRQHGSQGERHCLWHRALPDEEGLGDAGVGGRSIHRGSPDATGASRILPPRALFFPPRVRSTPRGAERLRAGRRPIPAAPPHNPFGRTEPEERVFFPEELRHPPPRRGCRSLHHYPRPPFLRPSLRRLRLLPRVRSTPRGAERLPSGPQAHPRGGLPPRSGRRKEARPSTTRG